MVTDRIFRQTLRKRASGLTKNHSVVNSQLLLNSLALGRRERPKSVLKRKFELARKADKLGEYFRLIIKLLFRPRSYRPRDLKYFDFRNFMTIHIYASSALIISNALLESLAHPSSIFQANWQPNCEPSDQFAWTCAALMR